MKKNLVVLFSIFGLLSTSVMADPIADTESDMTEARNSFEVGYNDVEEAVANALNQKGIDDKLSVTVVGRKNGSIFAYDKPISVEIKGLTVETLDHRWTASLLFISGGQVISASPATGHYDAMVELPVLKKEVRAGDIINDADIEIRDFSSLHVRTDTVTDISALIGKTPLHNLSPSRPLREHELINPAIVKKNALVEMQYNSPGMRISTTGEALGSGAKGDVIDVRNTTSKKIVRAVIADNKTVNIVAMGTQTSQLTGNGYAAN